MEKLKLDEPRFKKHMTQADRERQPSEIQASTFTFQVKQNNNRYEENRSEEDQFVQGSIDEFNYEVESSRRTQMNLQDQQDMFAKRDSESPALINILEVTTDRGNLKDVSGSTYQESSLFLPARRDITPVDESERRLEFKDRVTQSKINSLRNECDGDDGAFTLVQKLWTSRSSKTRVELTKRETFLSNKHKKAISKLLDPHSPFFFQRYLTKDSSSTTRRRRVEIDHSKLVDTSHPEHPHEEQKLMTLLGMPQDKISERLKHYFKRTLAHMIEKELLEERKKQAPPAAAENNDFMQQTEGFIHLLFSKYGLQEVVVPGSGNAPIFEDIQFVESLNNYVNKLADCMTTKAVYLENDKHKI